MSINECAIVPSWAMTIPNRTATHQKYQHLLLALRRRITSATDSGNESLVQELRRELAILERET